MSEIGPQSRLDEILGRIDELDEANLAVVVQRLSRERRFLDTIINAVHEGILVLDTVGKIAFANAAALKLLGIRKTDIGSLTLWRLLPDLERSLDLDATGQLSEAIQARELEILYPEPRYIRVYLVPLERIENLPRQYAAIVSDITREQVETEERVESERIQSILNLAAGVAHELGNPLNSLTIHLQLLDRQLKKLEGKAEKRARESLAICRAEVDRLDGIITHFLEAVRPQPPDLQELAPIAVVEEVLEVMKTELRNSGLEVEVTIEGEVPTVLADRNQLKQVFFNLFKNAREAMAEGGSLKVQARADEDFVYIAVADTGVGIERDELTKVFQPYFTTKSGGHGLGMMIVQRILRDHGGQVGIDSRPGVGTVVTLQFPQRHRRSRLLPE